MVEQISDSSSSSEESDAQPAKNRLNLTGPLMSIKEEASELELETERKELR